MKHDDRRVWVGLLALVPLMGCAPDCPPPATLDGAVFSLFGNIATFNTQASAPYPGVSPANGRTTWEFAWGAALDGPVTVTVDGQAYQGSGRWLTDECNLFFVEFSGQYERQDVIHDFNTAGNFLFYDATLEGSLAWNEIWTDGDRTGTLDAADVVLSGSRAQ